MKLFFPSGKQLKFDTRVSFIQNYLISKLGPPVYVGLIYFNKKPFFRLLGENYAWLKLGLISFFKIGPQGVAYLPDLKSFLIAFPYIILGGCYIFDIHDYEHDRAPLGAKKDLRSKFLIFIMKFACKRATAILTVSHLMKRFVTRYFYASKDKIFTLYNTFSQEYCSCGSNHNLFLNLDSNKSYKIGFIGMKSKFRGSDQLVESIKNSIFISNLDNLEVEFVWFGDKKKTESFVTNITKNIIIRNSTFPLLCQYCLSKGVSRCDLLVHAYKPDFANARHAVPNKLFSFLNFMHGNAIFVGDYECRKLIANNTRGSNIKWISSSQEWDIILKQVSKESVSFMENQKNYIDSKNLNNTTSVAQYSFNIYNNIEILKFNRIFNCE